MKPGPICDGYLTDKPLARQGSSSTPVLLEAIDAGLRSEALAFFADFDAIHLPAVRMALPRVHGSSHGDSFEDWSYMTVQNLLGWPCLSLRAGESPDGLAGWRSNCSGAVA